MNKFDDMLRAKQPPVQQPTIPIQPVVPESKPTDFTKEDIEHMLEKKLREDKRIRRREKTMIKDMEFDRSALFRNSILIMAVVGVGFVLALFMYSKDEWVLTVVVLVGCMMFIPIGAILGWMFDPYIRCKMMRRMTKKNYGMINFISKGNKMVAKMKDFDNSLIWKKNECWVLSKEGIHQLTKNGNALNEGKVINADSIVTVVDTVPMIYVDLDSFEVLTFAREGRERVKPSEIGSSLKAWEDNQRAKLMSAQKTMNILIVVAVIAAVAAAFLGYLNMTKMEEISTTLKVIQGYVAPLIAQ